MALGARGKLVGQLPAFSGSGAPGPQVAQWAPPHPAQHSCPGAASVCRPARCRLAHTGIMALAVAACQSHRSEHATCHRCAAPPHLPFSSSGSLRSSYHPLLEKAGMLSGGAGASKPALPCVLPCSANRSSVLPEARARTWGLILTPLLPSPPPHAAGLETLSSLSPDAPPILSSPH